MSSVTSVAQQVSIPSGFCEPCRTRMERQERTEQAAGAEQAKSAAVPQDNPAAGRRDNYVQEEKTASAGVYRLNRDENGNPEILFDDPENAAAEVPGKSESCTADTDQVDAEIKRLKEKKEKLEQQLAKAGQAPDKLQKLQQQLRQVEQELQRKDNDNYRRQKAEFTCG